MTRALIRILVAAAICTLPAYSLADSHDGKGAGAGATDEQPTVTDSQRSTGSSTANQAGSAEGITSVAQPTPRRNASDPEDEVEMDVYVGK